MKILLKTIHGSHLYGTNIASSDTDSKVIYLPDKRTLLLGKVLRNKQINSNSQGRNTSKDSDTEYIAVHTFVKDFVKGQTYALELAFCPNVQSANCDPEFYKLVMALRANCLTKDVSAMVGYCLGQARVYSSKGDRLNAVRKVRDFIVSTATNKKIRIGAFEDSLAGLTTDKYISFSTDETHTHLKVCDKLFPMTLTVGETLERLTYMESSFGERAKKAADMNGADWKALMHAVRVALQARELLSSGVITLPHTGYNRDYLLAVRSGDVSFEDILKRLDFLVEEVTNLRESSKLPSYNEVGNRAEDLLYEFVSNSLT
jgi:hypothetical protein